MLSTKFQTAGGPKRPANLSKIEWALTGYDYPSFRLIDSSSDDMQHTIYHEKERRQTEHTGVSETSFKGRRAALSNEDKRGMYKVEKAKERERSEQSAIEASTRWPLTITSSSSNSPKSTPFVPSTGAFSLVQAVFLTIPFRLTWYLFAGQYRP